MRRLAVLATLPALAVALAPAASLAAGQISGLTVDPSVVNNGASSTGTVTIAFGDGTPTTIQLFSDHPEAAQVPQNVVVPAGESQATFVITTSASVPETSVQITASDGTTVRTANMIVNEPPPAGPTLQSVSVTPTATTGGSGVTGTVTFSGIEPQGQGADVRMSSSNPDVASVPADVVVSPGKATATFAVTSVSVTATTSVTITATWFGIQRSATLTLNPGPPAPPDTVAIQQARCQRMPPGCLLQVSATSTNFNAILTVFSNTGAALFDLNNNGGGRYSGSKGFITPPTSIEVRSNFGGSAAANVSNSRR